MVYIKNPHDKLFRASLSNIKIAKDFLNIHLPKSVLAKIELDSLTFCPTSYIEDDLTEQFSDIVYYSKTNSGEDCYIYLVIEHQSLPQKIIPLRILKYQVAIMEYHLKQHQEDTKLPVVFPMLFYQEQQDKRPYPYSLDILDLFADRIFAEQTLAKPAHLIDITTFSDDDIKKHKLISLLEFLLKHSRDRDLLLIMNDLKQIIIDVCNKTCNDENLLAFYIEYNLYYIINVGNVKDRNEFINQLEMIPVIKEKIMGSIMRSLAREFKAEAKAEGRAEGEKEKSQSIAINMLKKGLPINTIAEVTELPMFEIMNLQKNNLPHKLDA